MPRVQGARTECKLLGGKCKNLLGQVPRACSQPEEDGRGITPIQALDGGPPHKDLPPTYSFHLLAVHKSATDRQLSEALAIARDKSPLIMNSKSEFVRNCIVGQGTTYNGMQIQEESSAKSPDRKRKKCNSAESKGQPRVQGGEEQQESVLLQEAHQFPATRNRSKEQHNGARNRQIQLRLAWDGSRMIASKSNGR